MTRPAKVPYKRYRSLDDSVPVLDGLHDHTDHSDVQCGDRAGGFICTRVDGHGEPHVAGYDREDGSWRLVADWPL